MLIKNVYFYILHVSSNWDGFTNHGAELNENWSKQNKIGLNNCYITGLNNNLYIPLQTITIYV